MEFPLWHNRICAVLGVLGHRFEARPGTGTKDPALPQLWHRWQLQLGSDPWPRELQMPRGSQKRKRGKKRNASLRRQPGTSTLLTHRAGPSFSALNLPVLGFVLLSKEKVHPQSGWKCLLTSKVNYPLEPPLLRILRLNSICSLPAAQRTSHVSLPAPQLSSAGLDGAFCWNS